MKYYIIAGEASGDLHGANLMRALLDKDSDATIRFWGGDRMDAVMRDSQRRDHITHVRHIKDLAYMGFVEVAAHLGTVMGNLRFCKKDILDFAPDAMVFIDYPGFNLKIAKFTHAHGIKNIHYISPQIWAWKKNRIRPMRRDLDRLCYILPTEQRFFADNDFPQATYVGHPLLDEVANYKARACTSGGDTRTVALLPGSRKQEIKRMMPLVTALARRHSDMQFVLAGMSLIGKEFYSKFITPDIKNIELAIDSTYDVLSSCHAAIVCSGTATLETALFRVPQVVCYQTSRVSAAIVRAFIDKKLKYISLVNIIADAPVVTELIQSDFRIDKLDGEFQKITSDADNRDRMGEAYDRIAGMLGGVGASARTADEIISIAEKH